MWRAAKNAILVKTNLVKWQVLQEANCGNCQSHSEDVLHALWLCPCLTELQYYKRVQPVRPTIETINLHTTATWSPPQAPFLKINYNGAVFRDSNSAGIRVVIRDSEGGVLASLVEKIPLPQTGADVEAAAARRAIMLAKDLNLSSIMLKGDSEIITKAVQAEE
nr:hypothetical protein CFP56_60501 [Quercus suber]